MRRRKRPRSHLPYEDGVGAGICNEHAHRGPTEGEGALDSWLCPFFVNVQIELEQPLILSLCFYSICGLGLQEAKKVEKEEDMGQVANDAAAEIHAAKLQGNPEPKLSVPKLMAIAFIKFHREIAKKKRDLVVEEFNELRMERSDDTWVTGGEGYIKAVAIAKEAKKAKKAKKANKQPNTIHDQANVAKQEQDDGPGPPTWHQREEVYVHPAKRLKVSSVDPQAVGSVAG
jgi:hypothetical protein